MELLIIFCCKEYKNNFKDEPRKFINCCEQKSEEVK